MVMRADTEVYAKSLLAMENFVPTLQGTAERAPGTRFVLDLLAGASDVRIFPYLTPANQRAMILMTPTEVQVLETVTEGYGATGYSPQAATLAASTLDFVSIVDDPGFANKGLDDWTLDPIQYTVDDGKLGCAYQRLDGDGGIYGQCREYKNLALEKNYCRLNGEFEVPAADPTNKLFLQWRLNWNYINPVSNNAKATVNAVVKVGTTLGGSEIKLAEYDDIVFGEVDLDNPGEPVDTPTDFTGTVYVEVEWNVAKNDSKGLGIGMRLEHFNIFSQKTVDLGDQTAVGTPPWTVDELPDIHFVQSPYNKDFATTGDASQEVVFVHPNHPPWRLYWNGTNYILEEIPFDFAPPLWDVGNYPSTCTAALGRLVLAGGNNAYDSSLPVESNSETVWATVVAEWNKFSDPSTLPESITPEASLEFTTTYRSPIQWVFGQKELMIGAQTLEYIAIADGIYAPNDLGVALHSSHGSAHVQPVALGPNVVFAADGGSRVRAMAASSLDQGYVAQDLTLWHPDLCGSGIKRIVRMRNPHQMVVVLLNNGELALLHIEPYAEITGWSRLNLNANIKDICVIPDENGLDTLFMVVRRKVNGATKLYLEAIPNWTHDRVLDYMGSAVVRADGVPSSTVGGLTHLMGENVQVVGDTGYLGVFRVVDIGAGEGGVELVDQIGQPIVTTFAVVGLTMVCSMRTLPVNVAHPRVGFGSKSRYSTISVRVRSSTIPRLGVLSTDEFTQDALKRPEVRNAKLAMNKSPALQFISDFKLNNLGSDIYQTVVVEEDVPMRCEVLGIYGKLTSDSS
jgi:hypothetical protein